MDQTSLVTMFETGQRFVDVLKRTRSVKLEAAFWWLDDHDEWSLVIATPVVHEKGRLETVRRIEAAIRKSDPAFLELINKLHVMTPSEGLMTVLDGGRGKVPLNRLITRQWIRGAFARGAYFYHFALKTFAEAS